MIRFFLAAFSVALAPALVTLATAAPGANPAPGPSRRPIQLLLPNTEFSGPAQDALAALIKEYKGSTPIQVIRRGQEYSSLRELIAMELAGDKPELAAIESAELPAAESLGSLQPISKSARTSGKADKSLAFQRTFPVLLGNLDLLNLAGRKDLPRSWAELVSLAKTMKGVSTKPSGVFALALPLQGYRGLWVFEALSAKPLWRREAGGLQMNRDLASAVGELQSLIDAGLARPEENIDRAIESFIEGKTALLLTSSDTVPYLQKEKHFRWVVGPLPAISNSGKPDKLATLQGGTDLVATQTTPAIQEFLDYLYSPAVASRWAAAGGFALPGPNLEISELAPVIKTLKLSPLNPSRRTTDREVVRARSAWVQSLHLLFGEQKSRVPTENVLIELDRQLGTK